MIEVRINMPDKHCRDPGIWETALFEKLTQAGIPVRPDGSVPGALKRFFDSGDFGVMIYQWISPAELYMQPDQPNGDV